MKRTLITLRVEMSGSAEKQTISADVTFAREPQDEIDYALEDRIFKKFDAALDAAKIQIRKLSE